jgi:DNA repair exonuclease SbcCD ATPase subunit
MKVPRLRRRSKPDEGASATSEQQAAKPAPQPARPQTVEERLEAVRGWVARLERRLGVRTYAGMAGLILAIAAAAVALVLLLQLREDAATEDDIRELSEQISGVEDSATEAAQEDVQSVSQRLTQLEQQLTGLESERDSANQQISVLEDDIQDLRDQISELDSGPGTSVGGAGVGGGGGSGP